MHLFSPNILCSSAQISNIIRPELKLIMLNILPKTLSGIFIHYILFTFPVSIIDD